MLNIFKKGHETLTSDIDTWVVRWNRRYGDFSGSYEKTAQFFTDKSEALRFQEELKRAIKLLGHTACHLTDVRCERVKKNSCE
jgi:phage regulator Rha-like protein